MGDGTVVSKTGADLLGNRRFESISLQRRVQRTLKLGRCARSRGGPTHERRFPVRIRIAIPPEGLGRQHARMTAWLDENWGAGGWGMTPSGTNGVLNDAVC